MLHAFGGNDHVNYARDMSTMVYSLIILGVSSIGILNKLEGKLCHVLYFQISTWHKIKES